MDFVRNRRACARVSGGSSCGGSARLAAFDSRFWFFDCSVGAGALSYENKRAGGTLLVVVVLLLSAGLPALLLFFAWRVSPWLYVVLETVFCWQILATKSLRDESRAVYAKLASGDLPGARKAVSMIVGRDTDTLDVAGVTRAAVETVAENASDGVAAPLFTRCLAERRSAAFIKRQIPWIPWWATKTNDTLTLAGLRPGLTMRSASYRRASARGS